MATGGAAALHHLKAAEPPPGAMPPARCLLFSALGQSLQAGVAIAKHSGRLALFTVTEAHHQRGTLGERRLRFSAWGYARLFNRWFYSK